VTEWRAAILGGLLYAVPYAIWLVGGLHPAQTPPDLIPAHRALLWSQALALVALLPAVAGTSFWRSAGALLLLLTLPTPLLAIFVRAGTAALPRLLLGQLALMVLAVAAAALWHLTGWAAREAWQGAERAAIRGLLLLGLLAGLATASRGLGL